MDGACLSTASWPSTHTEAIQIRYADFAAATRPTVGWLASLLADCHERKDHTMSGAAAAYLVAISAMLFSALSALTLINAVKHLDPPSGPPSATQVAVHKKAAV